MGSIGLLGWGEMRARDLIDSWHHDILHGLEIARNRALSLDRAVECLISLLLRRQIIVLRTCAQHFSAQL